MTRAARLLAFGLGLGLLVAMVRRVGVTALVEQLGALGSTWLLLLPVSASWFLLNTWAWSLAFPGGRPRLGVLLRAHLAGEAIGNVTPLLSLGGEPVKLALLRGSTSLGDAAVSLAADGFVHLATAPLFIAVGLGAGWLSLAVPPSVSASLGACLAILTIVVAVAWRGLSGGVAARLVRSRMVARLAGLVRMDDLPRATTPLEAHLRRFLSPRNRALWSSVLLHFVGRLMGAVEAWVILSALGVEVSLAAAVFLISVLHVLVNLVFAFVPSQLGAQEAVAYLIFAAVGLDPTTAVALSLVRRVRSVFWIALGLALLVPGHSAGSGGERRGGA